MNTDALFDDVNKKDCLFSDEEDEISNINTEKLKENDIFTFKNHKEVSSSYKKNDIENNIESDYDDCLFSDDE